MADVYNAKTATSSVARNSIGVERKKLAEQKLVQKKRRQRMNSLLQSSFENKKPSKSTRFWSAFSYYPSRMGFINKDNEEEIILFLRKHPVTNVKWITIALAMIVLPAFFSVFPLFEKMPFEFQVIFIIIWYLLISAFVLEEFLSWFYNVNIITDERIIEVDFLNLIYREMADANIDKIEDVTVKIGGSVKTFFNYGNVYVQTAAEVPEIAFENVPRPDDVAKILRDLRIEEEQEKIEGRVR